MQLSVIRSFVLVGVMIVWPALAYAQEATVSGIVTDVTGAVLPGVTVTVVHEASGNVFTAVTDAQGGYRLPARAGLCRVMAELSGFAGVAQGGLEILVGQQLVVNLRMAPSTVQESVTVTGEAPLIDVVRSELGTNIDTRQMSDLPVNGRNWMDLTMLAAGSRVNAVAEDPGANGTYQINVDGQQMTQTTGWGFGQPRFSRDAIAEFEFIANRFDATQGRSNGLQVNAITKSGTNALSGSFSGYFRDERLNAADFIQKRVLPYSDQQLSVTFGGPIRRDRFISSPITSTSASRRPSLLRPVSPVQPHRSDRDAPRRQGGRAARRAGLSADPPGRARLEVHLLAALRPPLHRRRHREPVVGGVTRPAFLEPARDTHASREQPGPERVQGRDARDLLDYQGYANWPDHPLGPPSRAHP